MPAQYRFKNGVMPPRAPEIRQGKKSVPVFGFRKSFLSLSVQKIYP